MALTRPKVAQWIHDMESEMGRGGISVLYRDGAELGDEAIGAVYRDVRRCIFCNKRSEAMHFGMAKIEKPTSLALGGPNARHVRTMFYGLCKTHERLTEYDPDRWHGKLDKLLHEALRKRIADAAQHN